MRRYIPKDMKQIPENAERVFTGIMHDVYQWDQELFDGSTTKFEMLKRPDTVHIIAIKNEKIVLLSEEQPHVGSYVGYPGGRADVESEDELGAAKRELAEEAGMVFRSWKLIAATQRQSKMDHLIYTFVASDFDKTVEQKLDAGEKVSAAEYSFEEFKDIAGSEQFRDTVIDPIQNAHSFAEINSLPDLYDL